MKTYITNFSLLIILLYLVNSTKLHAQSCVNIPLHETHINEKHHNNTTLRTQASDCDIQKKIRVYFHLAKKGATSTWKVNDVMDVLNVLNKDYNSHNIFFEWNGIINFTDAIINDSNLWTDPNFVNNTDGVDIYISADGIMPDGHAVTVGGFQGSNITTAIYVSGTTGYMQQGSYPPYYPAAKTSLISHEMGHLLGLFHIDYKDKTGCQEYADGTNAHTCGDYISDTPPVNNGYYYENSTCQYVEDPSKSALLLDPLGNKYPSAKVISDNIMRGGAMFVNCYSKFTTGQAEKMCNIINTNSHLKNTLSILTSVQTEQDLINFDIYPNPIIDNKLFITSKGNLDATFQIIIKDLLGKPMLKRESVNNVEIIDVSEFPKGVYLLTIITATEKVLIKKIVIN